MIPSNSNLRPTEAPLPEAISPPKEAPLPEVISPTRGRWFRSMHLRDCSTYSRLVVSVSDCFEQGSCSHCFEARSLLAAGAAARSGQFWFLLRECFVKNAFSNRFWSLCEPIFRALPAASVYSLLLVASRAGTYLVPRFAFPSLWGHDYSSHTFRLRMSDVEGALTKNWRLCDRSILLLLQARLVAVAFSLGQAYQI